MADTEHPAFQTGVQLFNAGHWWEAHEAWEPLWLHAGGQDRTFYQALILLAAALHKRWHHGSLTHRNYDKALRHLAQLPPSLHGVNLQELRHDVWQALHDPALRPAIHPQPGPPTGS